jgi:hypothetical protein
MIQIYHCSIECQSELTNNVNTAQISHNYQSYEYKMSKIEQGLRILGYGLKITLFLAGPVEVYQGCRVNFDVFILFRS